jgi:DNA-binding NarL/FixJ family response regulator
MHTPIRVLLCDDQPLIRAGLKAVLGAHPAMQVVGEAGDGSAALDEVERLRPHVVLMDVEMPRLNGIEATRRITRAHRDVKVLIVTMYDGPRLVAECLDAGAAGYVLKDVAVSQVAGAVAAVAAGRRYLSPAAAEILDRRGRAIERGRTPYDLLTDREREVLKLLADGLSLKEVAGCLGRSVKTVEAHKYNLTQKLGVHHRAGLVKYAIAHGLVQVPVLEDLAGLAAGVDAAASPLRAVSRTAV